MWFFGELRHISAIARENDNRASLGERYLGQNRVQHAAVPRQARLAEECPGIASSLQVNGYDLDFIQYAVYRRISRSAAQHLREGCRGRNNVASPPADRLEWIYGPRVAASQFDKAFSV
jgi:hypothetical protein